MEVAVSNTGNRRTEYRRNTTRRPGLGVTVSSNSSIKINIIINKKGHDAPSNLSSSPSVIVRESFKVQKLVNSTLDEKMKSDKLYEIFSQNIQHSY
jgi:hypothetical protein